MSLFKKTTDEELSELLNKAKDLLAQGFCSMAAKKNCIEYVSRAFDDVSWDLKHEIIALRDTHNESSKEWETLEKLSWSVPMCCHWKEKHSKMFANFENTKKLDMIKALYDQVKAQEVVKIVMTPIMKKASKVEKAYKESNINDVETYKQAVSFMIDMLDEEITPYYNEIIVRTIDKCQKEGKQFLDMNGDLEENVTKWFEEKKQMFLMDTELKILKTINFDITSYELKYCNGYNQEWRINGDKLFEIRLIVAGGWNIQRLHHRVITILKKERKEGLINGRI